MNGQNSPSHTFLRGRLVDFQDPLCCAGPLQHSVLVLTGTGVELARPSLMGGAPTQHVTFSTAMVPRSLCVWEISFLYLFFFNVRFFCFVLLF